MKLTGKSISEIMVRNVVSVLETFNINLLDEIFSAYRISHLPVLDSKNDVSGIISKKDYFYFLRFLSNETSGKEWTKKQKENFTAKEIMTPSPITLKPDDKLELAIKIFLETNYHCIPIVEEKKLVGVLTPYDILKEL